MYIYTKSPKGISAFRLDHQSLSATNRWVIFSELIPWSELEVTYADQFTEGQGAPAKPFRMALGALVIKEYLGLSDVETVAQIQENPYLQYFIGLDAYHNDAPFEASLMVHFRKRIGLEQVNQINERIVQQALVWACCDTNESATVEPVEVPPSSVPESDQQSLQGQLILDATCSPADIRYPTDIQLLNDAREHTESIIDQLYEQTRTSYSDKPRTYRQKARQAFLHVSKKRRVSAKVRRKGIRKQLAYLRRNLGHIDALIEAGARLSKLSHRDYRLLLVVSELVRQQQQMYDERSRRIDHRIVSLTQPHVRPIVRGKQRHPVEFGAKLSASCSQGFVFLDHLSWDNFNESGDLQSQAKTYKRRFGTYPATIYADAIYRTRDNRRWCQQEGIRLMGPPLGRPASGQKTIIAQQLREDEGIRNQIEGKFGQGKRRFSLNQVRAKLANTAETSIAITFIVMNLEYLLRQVWCLFFLLFGPSLMRFTQGHRYHRPILIQKNYLSFSMTRGII